MNRDVDKLVDTWLQALRQTDAISAATKALIKNLSLLF